MNFQAEHDFQHFLATKAEKLAKKEQVKNESFDPPGVDDTALHTESELEKSEVSIKQDKPDIKTKPDRDFQDYLEKKAAKLKKIRIAKEEKDFCVSLFQQLPGQRCVEDFMPLITESSQELEYDNYEFYSFEEETNFASKNSRLQSDTHGDILDAVDDAIEFTDAQDDFEEYLTSSTPISWSPRRDAEDILRSINQNFNQIHPQTPQEVRCDAVQNVDQVLAQMPQLQRIEEGKVYNMEPILEAIQQNDDRSERYSMRKVERHDYKKLHHGKK